MHRRDLVIKEGSTFYVMKKGSQEKVPFTGLQEAYENKWGLEAILYARAFEYYDYDVEHIIDMIRNGKSVWMVVAALLMTVGFAGMLLSPTFFIVEGTAYTAVFY